MTAFTPSLAARALHAALPAAQAAAGAQHYPKGALYMAATPIGNLADISLRALHVLALADAIACEDTRHTRQLLGAYGVEPRALLAVHQHNETEGAQAVIARLARGERVAFVSDAGTPAVSDPGARLAAAVRAAGHAIVPLPGASSVTAALSVAGAAGGAQGDDRGFVFAGFMPGKAAARREAIEALAAEPRAVVLLEAPHRIQALAGDLAALGARAVTVARELTKQFEQIATLPAQELPAWLAADAQRQRGEFALVLHPAPHARAPRAFDEERLLCLLMDELPLKTAARLAAEATGGSRNALYARGLEIRQAKEKAAWR